ncbi:MAG: hypothetical protein O2819_03610 [Planctomycetota bacterium]|nr:hypothetical protein [Planctomycetota bacterium]MDA1105589.1 hypothetical protein [Planctomycetota bacterium]
MLTTILLCLTMPLQGDAAGKTAGASPAPTVVVSMDAGHDARVQACLIAGWPSALAEHAAVGVERLVAMQEEPGQWPYEGVYRVGGEIPVGYRIGGTAICAEALLSTPGYADDAARRDAVEKAMAFVCQTRNHPLMDPVDYEGGYDVRGWGHCYGARFLLLARAAKAVPEEMVADTELAIDWYVDALQKMEIAEVGGWNYALRGSRLKPSPASPFMTAPCVETLLLAQSQGEAVDPAILDRAMAVLQVMRGESGYVDYSADKAIRDQPGQIPGAVGRMCAVEAALQLGGLGSPARAESAVRAFGEHWDALEARRAKNGTHKPPYGVAPYYFMYAHWRAALAAERAPQESRAELRSIVLDRLSRTRSGEGTWNDRVFPRSANFGTACALLTMGAPWTPRAGSAPAPADAPAAIKN